MSNGACIGVWETTYDEIPRNVARRWGIEVNTWDFRARVAGDENSRSSRTISIADVNLASSIIFDTPAQLFADKSFAFHVIAAGTDG